MNKKQVGALLKVMGKDPLRPALSVGRVMKHDGRTVLAVTDGYKLAIVYMDGAEEMFGKQVRRSAVEKWYKLATGKSRLTGEELVDVLAEDFADNNSYDDSNFPDITNILDKLDNAKVEQDAMTFNAEFMKIMQDLDGADNLSVELYGKLEPMVIRTDYGIYMVMPMKG